MPRKPRAQRTPEEKWQIELEGPETELLKTCLVVQEDDVVRPVLLVVYGHVVTFFPERLNVRRSQSSRSGPPRQHVFAAFGLAFVTLAQLEPRSGRNPGPR